MTDLNRLFKYDDWANREALASLERCSSPPPRAIELLAHIAAAQKLWHARIHAQKVKIEVWPKCSLGQCREHLEECAVLWREALRAAAPGQLQRRVQYVNSRGEPWEDSLGEVLQHVLFHGAYHRGQIATHLRAAGFESPYTDYIHAIRQGLIPS